MKSPEDVFPLLLLARLEHPDVQFREELRGVLEEWVASLRPRHETVDVADALRACQGTTLEPFVLSQMDLEIASLLVRAAFSDACCQTRFRIVSRETLGSSGGCVMTSNLKQYYVERFALGNRRRTPVAPWHFAPRNLPYTAVNKLRRSAHAASRLSNGIQAKLRADDSGYRVDIKGIDLGLLQWPENVGLASLLQKHTVIGAARESLGFVGLRAEVTKDSVSLVPASPEATMRLTAHLLSESLIVMEPGKDKPGRFKLYLRLASPSDDEQPLKAIVAATTGYFKDWLDVGIADAPDLTESQRLAIARWLMPHDSWVDLRLLEVI